MKAVLRSPSRRVHDEGAYVLTALGIPFQSGYAGGLYVLDVAADEADRAGRELVEYFHEDPLAPHSLVAPTRRGRPWPGALLYIAIVCVVYGFSGQRAFGIDWWGEGLLDAARIRNGEWWRAITALTLHADIGHIISNVIFGAFFGALLAEACGNGLGWSIVVLSGFVGNLLNVAVRSGGHRAVGASTAIFGALGALAAHEWARGWTDAADVARRWAPLVGGIILFGMLGLGDADTDVVAHATGFACGAVLGVAAARLRILRRVGRRSQRVLAVVAVGALVAGWAMALTN